MPVEKDGSKGALSGWDQNTTYSVPFILTEEFGLADLTIDCDVVAPSSQEERKILSKRLKSAVL